MFSKFSILTRLIGSTLSPEHDMDCIQGKGNQVPSQCAATSIQRPDDAKPLASRNANVTVANTPGALRARAFQVVKVSLQHKSAANWLLQYLAGQHMVEWYQNTLWNLRWMGCCTARLVSGCDSCGSLIMLDFGEHLDYAAKMGQRVQIRASSPFGLGNILLQP